MTRPRAADPARDASAAKTCESKDPGLWSGCFLTYLLPLEHASNWFRGEVSVDSIGMDSWLQSEHRGRDGSLLTALEHQCEDLLASTNWEQGGADGKNKKAKADAIKKNLEDLCKDIPKQSRPPSGAEGSSLIQRREGGGQEGAQESSVVEEELLPKRKGVLRAPPRPLGRSSQHQAAASTEQADSSFTSLALAARAVVSSSAEISGVDPLDRPKEVKIVSDDSEGTLLHTIQLEKSEGTTIAQLREKVRDLMVGEIGRLLSLSSTTTLLLEIILHVVQDNLVHVEVKL